MAAAFLFILYILGLQPFLSPGFEYDSSDVLFPARLVGDLHPDRAVAGAAVPDEDVLQRPRPPTAAAQARLGMAELHTSGLIKRSGRHGNRFDGYPWTFESQED